MADTKTLKARTLQKRDTSANWTKANPVILNGEIIIVETESGEIRKKIGDGVKTYTELPFDDEVVKSLINDNKQKITEHAEESIVSNDGVHGFRYNAQDYAFEVFANETEGWINLIEAGSIGTPLTTPLNGFAITRNLTSAFIMWGDPDYSEDPENWNSTVVVRKEGSVPQSPRDGVEIVRESGEYGLNMWKDYALVDNGIGIGYNGLDPNKEYCYRIFPLTTLGIYNRNVSFSQSVPSVRYSDFCTSFNIIQTKAISPFSIQLKWEDPDDETTEMSCEESRCEVPRYTWGKTRILYSTKNPSEFEENDGTIVVETSLRDMYKDSPLTIEDLQPSTTYYIYFISEDEYGASYANTTNGNRFYDDVRAITTPSASKVLNDNSWDIISKISERGVASNYWSVGDCKAVDIQGTIGTLELDTTLWVYILGFDHNSELEGVGITFGCFKTAQTGGVDVCLCDSLAQNNTNSRVDITGYVHTSESGEKYFNFNHWGDTSFGGWKGSDMRYDILGSTDTAPSGYGSAATSDRVGFDGTLTTPINPVSGTLMAALPSELRNVMKSLTKYTNNVGGGQIGTNCISSSQDYLPLLSEIEVFGDSVKSDPAELSVQQQYQYYSSGNSKVKRWQGGITDSSSWWLRSPFNKTTTRICRVRPEGYRDMSGSSYGLGIAPIFLV